MGSDFIMQIRWHNHRDKIGLDSLDHLPVVGVSRYMEAVHGEFQRRLVRLRNANKLDLIPGKVAEQPQVIHPHHSCSNNSNLYKQRLSTSLYGYAAITVFGSLISIF